MSDKETCTICLDELFVENSPVITRIQPCGHYYHTGCIDLWRERSNTCPTCRNDYDLIEKINQGQVVISSSTASKVDAIGADMEDIFESLSDVEQYEFENFTNPRIDRRIDIMVAHSNNCILCDTLGTNITACNSCSSTFHANCLGLGGLTHWVCPMCDAEQGVVDRPSRFRRSRNSAITDRVYNSLRNRPQRTMTVQAVNDIVEAIPIEEQSSWDSFELARSQQNPGQAQTTEVMERVVLETTDTPRKFKRPSRRRNNQPNIQANQAQNLPTSSNSLVNRIVGQLKEHRSPNNSYSTYQSILDRPQNLPRIRPPETNSKGSEVSSSSSSIFSHPIQTFSLSSNSSMESVNTVDTETTRTNNNPAWKISFEKKELSLEQKCSLQRIVRDQLRPIYTRGALNFDQYTIINKKVSHILYSCFIDQEDPNVDYEAIAEYHVKKEMKNLS